MSYGLLTLAALLVLLPAAAPTAMAWAIAHDSLIMLAAWKSRADAATERMTGTSAVPPDS